MISAANRTDMRLAEATLDGIVVERPAPTPERPQRLSRDRGFDYPETDQAAWSSDGRWFAWMQLLPIRIMA